MTRYLTSAALALLLLCPAMQLHAQLPAARVASLFPPGGEPGATVDVGITGADLDGATDLRFSHPGIIAKRIAGDDSQTEAAFAITIAKDVPPGSYDARVVGRFGISNPRAFVVEARPVLADAKPGTNPAGAPKLAPNKVAFARTTANAFDHWAFDAKPGERLLIRCDTKAIDSKMLPDLAVLDAAGAELARARIGGLLDFTAPAEGTYTLRVNELVFRGGPEFAYRACVSTAPQIDAIYPNVAKRGSKGTFTLLGRNLPGGTKSIFIAADGKPLDELRVEIDAPKEVAAGQRLVASGLVGPAGAALDGFAYRLNSERGESNAVAILLADTDVTLEAESAQPETARNDRPEDAQRLTVPAEVAGRFHPRNDRDCYVVDAKKGDEWVVEVVADRLGAPSAVSLLIQQVQAKDGSLKDVFASPDDEPNNNGMSSAIRLTTRDPVTRWTVKEDGTYRLSLRDRFGASAADPTRAYRLSIRKPSPDFVAVASPLSAAGTDTAVWSPILRKDGTAAIRVNLLRLDGHSGDVTVAVEGLPKGVECNPIKIGGTDTTGLLMIRGTQDLPTSWAGTVRVTASGTVNDAPVTRDALGGTIVWGTPGDQRNQDQQRNIDPVISRLTPTMALGVCGSDSDREPITVAAKEQKVFEVEVGKKLSIPLVVKRSVELKQGLKLKPVGVDGLRNAREVNIDAKKDEGTFELDLNQIKLLPGTYTVSLASPAQFKYVRPGNAKGGGDGNQMAKKDGKEKDGDKGKDKDKGKKDEGKEISVMVYSAPITFTVLPAPPKPEKSDKN